MPSSWAAGVPGEPGQQGLQRLCVCLACGLRQAADTTGQRVLGSASTLPTGHADLGLPALSWLGLLVSGDPRKEGLIV